MQSNSTTPNININPDKTDSLDTYVSSALSIQPSLTQSVGRSLSSGLLSTGAALYDLNDAFSGKHSDENIKIHQLIDSINEPLKNVTSPVQSGFDFAANLVGQALSLGPIAGEQVFAKGAEATLPLIGKAIPSAVSGAKVAKLGLGGITTGTIGQLAASSYKSAAMFAGFTLPQTIDESYNPETNKFNFGKAAISMLANGGMGAAILAVPYLAGIIGSKISRMLENVKEEPVEPAVDTTPPTPTTPSTAPQGQLKTAAKITQQVNRANQALKNKSITPEEHQFIVDTIKEPNKVDLNQRALDLLDKMNYKTNKNYVYLNLISPEATKNLESVVTDELFSNLEKDATPPVSSFVIHNELDKLRENPEVADGIDGWVQHIDEVFSKKSERLSQFDLTGAPSELKDLHDSLFKNGKLRRNFTGLRAYHQLTELAPESANARNMLDKIHLENSYLAQTSYRNILAAYRDIIRSNLKRIANVDDVKDYLKSKINYSIDKGNLNQAIKQTESLPIKGEELPIPTEDKEPNKLETQKVLTSKVNEKQSLAEAIPEEPKSTTRNKKVEFEKTQFTESSEQENEELKTDTEEADKYPDSDTKENYFSSVKKFKQFSKSKQALKSFIKCVIGANNGEI
jgi:hypothetical protein